MTGSQIAQAFATAADELRALVENETAAIATNAPADELAPLVRAKTAAVDRVARLRAAMAQVEPLSQDSSSLASTALERLMPAVSANVALIQRRLDLVNGLIQAIEREVRRSDGRLVHLYLADGQPKEGQPAAVAVDANF